MPRPRALPATATLVVVTGLTLGAADALDMLERSARDVPVLQWLAPDRPETDPDRVAGASDVVTPGPTSGTHRGPASGPAPDPSSSIRTDGPHARIRSAPAPVLLHIGSLGVRATVVPIGVMPDGGTEVPDDVSVVGWYETDERRVSPGDEGTAVIVGPRGSRRGGEGALHSIATLRRGDPIDVVHLDGLVSHWRVQGVLTPPPARLASDVLLRTGGAPMLALVTWSGPSDRMTGGSPYDTIVLAAAAEDAGR